MHFDAFLCETLLACGPAAKVFRGVEVATGRKVRIKVLLPEAEATHPLDRERLQLLVPALLQMRHPQVSGFISLLPDEEDFALVHEFVPGMSGRWVPHERRLAQADLLALAVQLLQAVHLGELARFPHGDLKPSNLIIADHPAGGQFLQVQDWGLSLTRQSPVPETLWFAAPERLEGAAPSIQADLFTSAASMFYLATGSFPTSACATEAETLQAWGRFDLRGSLAALRPDLESAVADWLGWLLQPDPAGRPSTSRHALDMLMSIVHRGAGVHAAAPASPKPEARSVPSPRPPPVRPVPKLKTPPPAKARFLRALALLLILAAFLSMAWFLSPEMKRWLPNKKFNLSSISLFRRNATVEGAGVNGRFIRIALKGPGVLSLAEVEVFSKGAGIASPGTASQSTTYSRGPARRAVDGDTEEGFSQTLSKDEQPWWQLDLGQERPVTRVVIWNRRDKFASRLKNFTVSVLDDSRKILWQAMVAEPPSPSLSLPVGR
jgi:serine/threonine protein kinase